MSRFPVFAKTALVLALAATAASQLSACFPVVAAGVAVGALSAVDRRSLGAQTDDKAIAIRGESRMRERFGDRAHVNVTSYNRKVLLTGEVPDAAAKAEAERIAATLDNVTSIVNELTLAPPTTLQQRSADGVITAKVLAELLDARNLNATAIKVTTERGVVYLLGRVTQREGDAAANVAREVSDVRRVVKVFDYISEQELRSMNPPPSPPAAPSSTSTSGPR